MIVLKRQIKLPQLTNLDRFRLVVLSHFTKFWKQALHIVQPDTLLRWHQNLFRMSRRGNRNLKRAYFQIVAPMVWFDHGDNFYKNLYKRKMAEGRAWYTAMPFACAALARHIYHCLKFQEPYQLEKAFGRVLISHVDDLAKSKFQDDLEGTFEVMDAHLPQEVEL